MQLPFCFGDVINGNIVTIWTGWNRRRREVFGLSMIYK